MTKEKIYGIIIFATLVGLLIGFSVAIVLDSYTSKKRKKIFAVIIAMSFVLILQNLISYYLARVITARTWRIFVSVLGYSIRPAIIALYAYLFVPTKKHIFAWSLVGINAIMHTTAFYSGIVFQIASPNIYKGGPLKYLCLVISLTLLIYLAVLGFLSYKNKKADIKEVLFHSFWILIMMAGIVSDILWGYDTLWISYVTIAIVIAEIYSYIWLHQRFVADYETAVLVEQRYNTMMSQLRPHFIYNSLSAIAEIEGVPEKAQKAILDFSNYLRENLDSMASSEMIPFNKELEHINKYVNLEELRFGDKVNVVYNIEYEDFVLPAMAVQLLVENAVKHGITKQYEGGTVTIATKKDKGDCIIIVADDGVGFDTTAKIEGKHFGIEIVRKRLEYAVGGKLDIVSEIGKGTTATIVIPNADKEKK